MGQEDEASAELIATIQHDHVAMKNFYNNHPAAKELHMIYGNEYPLFWKDVIGWTGWKDARKLFLRNSSNGYSHPASTEAQRSETGNDNNVPKKRKSRWGAPVDETHQVDTEKIKRKSRWERQEQNNLENFALSVLPIQIPSATIPPTSSVPTVLDLLPVIPANLTPEQQEDLSNLQMKLKEANQRLENLEVEAARIDSLPRGHRDRSPSPPPMYDADGKRKNTRAVRWREKYTAQRQECLEAMLVLTNASRNISSVAPTIFNRKRYCKIPIPIEKHPTYNFIGLIIGPRGKTQKEMEEKTNCKIAIRGRGSVKEGARGRKDGKAFEGEDEELHVLITGDNQSSVDAAADMVRQMLVVIDDDKNIHKQQQLRELALLNGTLKEEEYCQLCAEKGHKSYECPKRFSMTSKKVSVKCALCGDTSHVTRDCMLNRNGAAVQDNDIKKMDSDYLNFMAELDGNKTNVVGSEVVDDASKVCQAVNERTVPSSSGTSGSSLIMTISTRKVKATDQSLLLSENDNTFAELTEGNQSRSIANILPSSSHLTNSGMVPLGPSIVTSQPSQPIPMTSVNNNTSAIPLGNPPLPTPPPNVLPLPPPSLIPSMPVSSMSTTNTFPPIPTLLPPVPPMMAAPYRQFPPHPQYTTAQNYYNPMNPYNQLQPANIMPGATLNIPGQQQTGVNNAGMGSWRGYSGGDAKDGAGGFNWWDE